MNQENNQPVPGRVLVTGVFDLLHEEHIAFLKKAQAAGTELWVGLETDARTKQIKGPDRPYNTLSARMEQIKALKIADQVFSLGDDFNTPAAHDQLIARVRPSILAVSSHTKHLDKKAAILAKYGGRVEIVHQHNPLISSTLRLEEMKAASS